MSSITQPGGTEKAGDIKFHAANAIPPGWLKANGAAVSRTAYAALFAAIGTTYGAGDGATTFNLPDLRGEFLRGYHDGSTNDPDYATRAFGSAQADALESHSHTVPANGDGTSAFLATGSGGGGVVTTSTGGAETRPRNVAMLACIKY